jgi:hypothetical protein
VVRRNHRIKLTAHCAHEDGVGGKWSLDSCGARRRRQKRRVLLSESATIAPVRIERAKRDPWLRDSEPAAQAITRNARCIRYRGGSQFFAHFAERNVGCRQNDAELIGREHHRDARSRQMRQHFRVSGKVVATGEQSGLVDRCRDNAVHFSCHRHFRCALDRQASQLSSQLGVAVATPPTDRLTNVYASTLRADDHNVTALADP